ncbi:MAG: DMT family transporter [Rhodobacteraceae bacterium]|nr:DMT family transporter [Paracoccaceae bacterium]
MPISDNTRGALLMIGSMAAFTLNDTFIKSVAPDLSLFQAILIRGFMTTALLAVFAVSQGALRVVIPKADWKMIGLRTGADIFATYCFLLALFNMPIASVTAILQSLPLVITLAGAVFFGEKVGWRRYGAILIGFGGVLLIIRPGAAAFDMFSIYALAAVGFVVVRDLSTRRLSRDVPSASVALINAAAIMAMGGVGTLIEGWQPVETAVLGRLAGAALFLIGGYLLSIMVMRVGEISVVAPFRYTALVWAIVTGILVFGEIPDTLTLIGSAIVVGMGIYTFYREGRLRRQLAANPAPRG